MEFVIQFKHLVENFYTAKVEADSKEEAKKLFDESPFDYVEGEPYEEQGIDIEIMDIEKL